LETHRDQGAPCSTITRQKTGERSVLVNTLFILNDPPYGTERSYNGLRLANAVAKREGSNVKVFLIGDAASCAKGAQKVPEGYYNIELMLKGVLRRNGQVGVCASCMDARGIADGELVAGTCRSSLEELTDWTLWADKVIVF
jgi:uncharacterized protein involved in oxidation of intracellular sulfur